MTVPNIGRSYTEYRGLTIYIKKINKMAQRKPRRTNILTLVRGKIVSN